MNVSQTIANMEAAGMTAEAIVLALKCIVTFPVIDPQAERRRAADRERPKSGAEERWGYAGPRTPMLPEKEWWPLRWAILQRDMFICAYCGVEGEKNTKWCVDHIVPLSRGGTNEPGNLTACCSPCNSSKSDRLLSEWKGRYL